MSGNGERGSPGSNADRGDTGEERIEDEVGTTRAQALRDVVKGSGVVYGGFLFEIVVAFVAQWLAARYLTIGEFGGLTLGTALVNIGAIVATLGLHAGLARYLPRVPDGEKRPLVRWSLFVSTAIGLLLGMVVFTNAGYIAGDVFGDAEVTVSVQVFGATIPIATVLMVSIGGIRGQKRSRFRVYVENLVRPLTRFVLVAVAVLVGAAQFGFALAYAAPFAVGATLALLLLRYRALPRAASVDAGTGTTSEPGTGERFREILSYSLPFVVSEGSTFVYRSADIFLLIFFLDSEAVGVYGVVYAVARLVMLPSYATRFIGVPVSSELEVGEDVEGMLRVHFTTLRWLVALSFPVLVPLVLFPTEFIATVYRPNYAVGAPALTALAAGFAVHNVLSVQQNLIEARGKSEYLAWNDATAGVVNVGLNLVLIPDYGVLGAAMATVTAYLLIDGLLSAEIHYLFGRWPFPLEFLVGPVLVGGITFLVASVPLQALPGTLPWIVLGTATYTVVFLAVFLLVLGVREEELMLLRSAEERYGLPIGSVVRLAERLAR